MALLVGLICWSCLGCSSLEEGLRASSTGPPHERREALLELERTVRFARADNPEATEERAAIDDFLRARFPQENDAVARSQLISLALQGEFPCADTLVLQGAQDTLASVRLTAVKAFRETQPAGVREVVTDLLRHDRDLFVRIEAAKVMAAIGEASWARDLAEVVIDSAEDGSLRFQAHRAANHLLGSDRPFLEAAWRSWLEGRE